MSTLGSVQVLGSNNNVQGTFASASAAPPAGTKQVVLSLQMSSQAIADATNVVRTGLEADFGGGFVFQSWGKRWQGGVGQTAPSDTFAVDPAHLALRYRLVFENGLDGDGSKAPITGATIAFLG